MTEGVSEAVMSLYRACLASLDVIRRYQSEYEAKHGDPYILDGMDSGLSSPITDVLKSAISEFSGAPFFRTNHDGDTFWFVCPKCGEICRHGSAGIPGHRASHCPCWPNGYFLDRPEAWHG